MKKTLTSLVIIILFGSAAFGQIDTSRVEFIENQVLHNIQILNTNFENITRRDLGDPVGPIISVEDPTILEEPCTLKRLVFFVHGLGGSIGSWERVSQAMMHTHSQGDNFKSRYCHTFPLEYYSQHQTLSSAADQIRDQIIIKANTYNPMPEYNPDPFKNFIIAHSQGGLVSRWLLHNAISMGRYGYGGLVTVASSLQGARIVNNRAALNQSIIEACDKLLKGPMLEDISTTIPWVNLILFNVGKYINNTACNNILPILMPEVMKDYNNDIALQYAVGSFNIDLLNNGALADAQSSSPVNMNMPKITFYGIESTNNQIWRTFNWMLYNPNSEDPWKANDDFKLLDETVIPLKNKHSTFAQAHRDAAEILKNKKWFWTPWAAMNNITQIYIHHNKADAWQQGVDWLNNANNGWMAITGTLEFGPTGPGYECTCSHGIMSYIYYGTDCNAGCVYPFNLVSSAPVTLMGWFYNESDGIVLAESAQDLPYATWQPIKLEGYEISPGRWTGSSHMQIRNDDALRVNLTKLLDGDYGEFFELSKQ